MGSNAKENTALDVCFSVGKEGSEKIFLAHKHILTLRCPAFETMFFEKYTGEIVPIAIPEDDPEAFGILLRYLYVKKLPCYSVSAACKTYSLAEKYDLPLLKAMTKDYICAVPMDNQIFWDIVENNLFFNAAVNKRCLHYIRKNTEELVTSESFLKMPESIVEHIVQMESISVGEFTLLKAVTLWCYNRYDGEIGFKEKLLKFLGQIRYSDMTLSEFYEFITHFPCAMDLPSSVAIEMYIKKYANNLPSWCTATGHRKTLGYVNV